MGNIDNKDLKFQFMSCSKYTDVVILDTAHTEYRRSSEIQ